MLNTFMQPNIETNPIVSQFSLGSMIRGVLSKLNMGSTIKQQFLSIPNQDSPLLIGFNKPMLNNPPNKYVDLTPPKPLIETIPEVAQTPNIEYIPPEGTGNNIESIPIEEPMPTVETLPAEEQRPNIENIPIEEPKPQYYLNKEEENVGFRSGNPDSYAENLSRHQGGRSTGHFGSGTYFFSNKEKANAYEDGKFGISKIDLSGKKMYRPENFEQGKELHDILRKINDASFNPEHKEYWQFMGIKHEESIDPNLMSLKLKRLGVTISPKDIKNIMDEVYNIAKTKGFPEEDTASTRIMKKAGFDGIDVRHISEMDNGIYGSVLYKSSDLSPKEGVKVIGSAKLKDYTLQELSDGTYQRLYPDGRIEKQPSKSLKDMLSPKGGK